ncbi:MAG TPA: hypothetical protein VJY39_16945 [Acidisphaera sp.]|nr:hypothetical protein [Acidisphaera sp.]
MTRRAAVTALIAAGVLAGLMETSFPSIIGWPVAAWDALHLVVGFVAAGLALMAANRFWPLPWRQPAVAVALACIGCVMAGLLGGVAWPNSADEYSYVVQADTFAAGRLWNAAPPDAALLESYHLLVKDGRMVSPYPPAWSAYLVPFRAIGVLWLANPLLMAWLGTALIGACRRLDPRPEVREPALALTLLTPFALFLGGSVFPHVMSCALVASLVWAQLADEARPRVWRKLLIGALFGALLLTRYDVFAVVAVVYAIDRLVLRRAGAIADGMVVVLGLLPFVVALGAYNAAIAGDPLQVTATWGSAAEHHLDAGGAGGLTRAASQMLFWAGSLAQFGGLPVALLAMIALAVKLRRRTYRFYDLLFPGAVALSALLPFSGGHQYGPRYWFWAWPLGTLTIVSAFGASCPRVAGRRFSLEGFASANLVAALASFGVLLVTTRAYVDARRAVFEGGQPDARAVVLLPTRTLRVWPWQIVGIAADSRDFTRNGIDAGNRVLYGRADLSDAQERACRLDGRDVFRWVEPGRLVRVACP